MTRPRGPRRGLAAAGAAAVLVAWVATPSAAQQEEPISAYVIDVRGALPIYGQNTVIASSRDIVESTLPSRGRGLTVGAHWFPLRWKQITFGAGGEFMSTSGEAVAARISDGLPETVRIEFVSFAPQLSFNFGHRQGWSFLSGGMGSTRFSVLGDTIPVAVEEPKPKTINYGGGARWFTRDHLAFSFDLRFYAMSPVAETAETPPTPRMTLLVLNVGVSFR